jgi:hypothetical protein
VKVIGTIGIAALVAGIVVIAAPVAAFTGFDARRSQAHVPSLDVLQVIVRDNEILAIDDRLGGMAAVRERLDVDEEPLYADARGEIGVVVTNKRILVASVESPRWMFTQIGVHESDPLAVVLGDRVALILTDHRALGVAADGRKKFFAEDIGPNESILNFLVGENVAVVVTDKRLLAVSAFLAGFFEQRIGIHEEIENVAALSDVVTVATQRRLLVFKAPTATWQEQRLSLH